MSREMKYVVPQEGLTVRFPRTMAILPPQGAWVEADNFWLRRINDGSVREARPPETVAASEKNKTNKKETKEA